MKTLISINRTTWGDVKRYATVQDLTLNSAIEFLLRTALDRLGLSSREGGIDYKIDIN
ncbi:MAG TPA: hypothetical protein VH796_05090 [Nitrososphaeraceae archaeon]